MALCESKAQNIDAPNRIELKYWRAFNEEIHIVITRDGPDELLLNAFATAPNGQLVKNPKLTVKQKQLRAGSLNDILVFANDINIRKAFSKSPIDLRPDGSRLELLLYQNGVAIGFISQNLFNASAEWQHKKLRKVVEELFTLGGLTIEKEFLY